ncbi:MAG: hypothetical protein Tsb005_08960 [Gammaproteobacteria bacterium]
MYCNETLLLAALDASNDGIVVSDLNQTDLPIVYANNAFTTMTGYSQAEIIGKNCRFLQGQDNVQTSVELEILRTAIAKREECCVLLKNYKKDGTLFWNELRLKPLLSDPNATEPQFYIGIQRDVTRRKAAIDALKRLAGYDETVHQEDVTHLENIIRKLKITLQMEAVASFAGGMAHNLNNILYVIDGNARLALDDLVVDHASYECLEEILHASTRGTEIITHLMKMLHNEKNSDSAILEYAIASDSTLINLKSALEDFKNIVSGLLHTNIELILTLPNEAVYSAISITNLEQILLNMVSNAKHALTNVENGTIKIKLTTAYADWLEHNSVQRYACISITDNGVGISKEHQQKIFNPFFTTRNAGKGTGFGLSTSYAIVKAHNGNIVVDSQLGKGTCFKIYLPCE